MSAIDTLFQNLRSENRKAFMPFVTAGDPDLDFTAAVLRHLAERGSSMFELGIPYSDPVADGPVIQASFSRALDKKIRLEKIFDMVSTVTPDVSAPIVSMLSYSIVYRRGLENYVKAAKAAGIAGAIVPDLPADESGELAEICRREDFSLVQLITPTTTPDRARQIADQTTGFIYYVSVTGITGERTELPPEIVDNVSWLREQTELPICIGFGISRPEHIRMLSPVADGLIVGSAIVRRIAEANSKPRQEVLDDVGNYVTELLSAL
ncbi:MAG: tryptophan synthase subunit alpha [Pirellulales bacterium]|nr:tryptophan synthase subunit alpha [Pirellulales bacterium]